MFKSFMEAARTHREIRRRIARAEESIAELFLRTTQNIEESRELLARVAEIADRQ
jgi:hypothetical protein